MDIPTPVYTLEEARGKLGHLVKDAIAGRACVITYHGVPAAIVSGWPQGPWQTTETVVHVADGDTGRVTDNHHR